MRHLSHQQQILVPLEFIGCAVCSFHASPSRPCRPVAVAFRLFDANGDGFIDRSELLTVLQATNKRGMTVAQLAQIVDSTMARWDTAQEGRLAYPAFKSLLSASSAGLSL